MTSYGIKFIKKLEDNQIRVTLSQIHNEWKNLKKRYKEVVDLNAKTGNERNQWKHLDHFNSVYGNKASTQVQSYFDSSNKIPNVQNVEPKASAPCEQSDLEGPTKKVCQTKGLST